ncbi:hypothetical protein ABZ746_35825, partial [Streptomyces sp. NPDC020096]
MWWLAVAADPSHCRDGEQPPTAQTGGAQPTGGQHRGCSPSRRTFLIAFRFLAAEQAPDFRSIA